MKEFKEISDDIFLIYYYLDREGINNNYNWKKNSLWEVEEEISIPMYKFCCLKIKVWIVLKRKKRKQRKKNTVGSEQKDQKINKM